MKEPRNSSSKGREEFRNNYGVRKNVNKLVDKFNNLSQGKRKLSEKHNKYLEELKDKGFNDQTILDGLIKYEDVLERYGKGITLGDYIKAIEFTTYVVGGSSYVQSYEKTFPNRVEKMKETSISSSASQYANGRLVKNMLERIYLNQHIFFIDKTINAKLKLYDIGMDSNVEDRERVSALDKFLTHTVKYENKSGAIINNFNQIGSVSIVNAIDEKLKKLAEVAQNQIEEGIVDAKMIAEDSIKVNDANS